MHASGLADKAAAERDAAAAAAAAIEKAADAEREARVKAEELSAVAHKECSDALLKAEGMEKLAARSEAEVERQLGKPDLKGWQVMCVACSSRHPVRVHHVHRLMCMACVWHVYGR